MFSKDTYIKRRSDLKKFVGNGVIILFGNNESPANYPANSYAPMRQDSSFLYYFGQHRDGLVGVIDIDNDTEILFGDDIDVEDIVWMGYTPSVADLAAEAGVCDFFASRCHQDCADEGAYILHQAPDLKDPFPPSLSLRHEDTDHGSAGHPPFQAEGSCLA